MIHPAVQEAVESQVGSIDGVRGVGGGCISNACRLEAAGRLYFLKWSEGEPGLTFEAEAEGLRSLRVAASRLIIPEVLVARNGEDTSRPGFILMEWIAEGPKGSDFWSTLGIGLGELHSSTGQSYGFHRPNFIGRIAQVNDVSDDWVVFFRLRRLEPQIEIARQTNRWRPRWDRLADRLLDQIGDVVPSTPEPSLVHGDLWAGNVIANEAGSPVLIDPATHFAHREVDLGMSELFGGFPVAFYDAYHDAWPIDPGYQERRDIYNLYHLINHLNHFGEAYAGQVERILQAY